MDAMRGCWMALAGATALAGSLLWVAGASGDSVRPLPAARLKGKLSLEEALARRRSVRAFGAQPLDQGQIGQLCWAAQGVTEKRSGKRASPSAGGLYPLELYVVTAEGVSHYLPGRHGLRERSAGDVRRKLAAAALGQPWVEQAPAVFVLTAVVARTQRKYGPRARRYVHMEVGHAGQNLLLQAEALGLAAVPVGAFDDKAVAEVLSLPRGEEPLYLIPVGAPAGGRGGR